MAKDPRFTPENYLFNGLYMDEILTEFLPKVRDEAFERAIDIQKALFENYEVEIPLSEFKIHGGLNGKFNFGPGVRAYEVKGYNIELRDKKAFIEKYGSIYDTKIPIMDTFIQNRIFKNGFMLTIGDNTALKDVYLVRTRYNSTLILLDKDLLSFSEYDNLVISNTTCVFSSEIQSAVYHINGLLQNIVTESANNNDVFLIKKSKLNTLSNLEERFVDKDYNKSLEDTNWDIFISKDGKLFSSSISRRVIGNNVASSSWVVNKTFINYIGSSNIQKDIYIIARPKRKLCIHYTADPNNLSVIEAKFTDNPVSPYNFRFYQYDKTKARKLKKIARAKTEGDAVPLVAFPNIYDMSKLDNLNDILVEVYENHPIESGQKFSNNLLADKEDLAALFKDLEKPGNYVKWIMSTDNWWKLAKDYKPKAVYWDYKDYESSEYAGDIRGYMLSKLDELCKSDPVIMWQLLEFIENKQDKMRVITGSYADFGIPYNSDPYTVMDNSDAIAINGNSLVRFVEPHIVLKFKCENPNTPFLLYYGDLLIIPNNVEIVNGETWVYVNIDATLYSSKFDYISIVIFPRALSDISQVTRQKVKFLSENEKIKLFDNKLKHFSLADIEIKDADTGEIYDFDKFNFEFNVTEKELKSPLGTKPSKVIISNDEELEHMMTLLEELYLTKDNNSIILSSRKITKTIDELSTEKVYNEFTDDLKITDIDISIKDKSLIGKNLIISNIGQLFYINNWINPDNLNISNTFSKIREKYIGSNNYDRIIMYAVKSLYSSNNYTNRYGYTYLPFSRPKLNGKFSDMSTIRLLLKNGYYSIYLNRVVNMIYRVYIDNKTIHYTTSNLKNTLLIHLPISISLKYGMNTKISEINNYCHILNNDKSLDKSSIINFNKAIMNTIHFTSDDAFLHKRDMYSLDSMTDIEKIKNICLSIQPNTNFKTDVPITNMNKGNVYTTKLLQKIYNSNDKDDVDLRNTKYILNIFNIIKHKDIISLVGESKETILQSILDKYYKLRPSIDQSVLDTHELVTLENFKIICPGMEHLFGEDFIVEDFAKNISSYESNYLVNAHKNFLLKENKDKFELPNKLVINVFED